MESDCEKEPCGDVVLNSHHDEPAVFEFNTNMVAWITVNVILVVFIICGNMLTIFAVRICRRLRAVVSNLFILSLAVSDMIVGLTLPYHMAFYLGSKLGQSHKLCLLRFYIVIFACCISIWNLVSIAADRYIAIVYPLHYRRYMTRRVAVTIIIAGWIVGTFVACIPVFWNHWHTAMECEFDQILPAWYMAGIITPGFIVMWLCMLLVHLRIWQEAHKQAKQMRKATCCHLKDGPSDWKSVQVVLLIMGSFTICWLPYFVVACGQIFVSYDTSPALYKGALSLAMANSGVNPIIYAWKNTNFRTSFGLLLRCKSPNGCYANEFSAREPYGRQITDNLEQGAATISTSAIVSDAPTLQVGTEGVIATTALATCNTPEGNSRAPTELNALQLFYCMEANRNRLPTLAMVANESCFSPGILCSSCELCKMILSKRNKLGQHLRGALVPWKCGDYNHHIINAMKCTW